MKKGLDEQVDGRGGETKKRERKERVLELTAEHNQSHHKRN